MTTEVKVRACCGPDTEVVIQLTDNTVTTENILVNGEDLIVHVYDTRTIEVFERLKCK